MSSTPFDDLDELDTEPEGGGDFVDEPGESDPVEAAPND